MLRVILFTGKGGVGKTTIAAATGLRAASHGHRTLVLSTDAAHSLSDSFDKQLGPEPVPVARNLWGQESDIYHNIKKHWGTVQKWLSALLAWRGVDDIIADELAVLPGMEELASLIWVDFLFKEGNFDVIIVDCAPTGESLRLLTFPEVAKWWAYKLLPAGKRISSIVSPLLSRIVDVPLPDKEIFDEADDLFRQLDSLKNLLADRSTSTIRLVLNPEKMVIKEAQRAYTYLCLYDYPVDCAICNKIIPETATGSFWKHWKESQSENVKFIEECFYPLPVLKIPFLRREAVGLKALHELGELLYGDSDPTQPMFDGKGMQVEDEQDHYLLELELPFVTKEKVSLLRSGADELIIHVGNLRRNIMLPRALAEKEVVEAKLSGGKLQIRFLKDKNANS